MDLVIIYSLVSVILVSLVSVIGAIPLLLKRKISKDLLLTLLSFSVGILLATAFIHLIPEAVSEGYTLGVAIYILLGFLIFFVIEKSIHWRHKHRCEDGNFGHGHAFHLAPINLIGDGVHNFIDGIIIAVSYAVSFTLGIAATISIIFHELPQEIADFGILLYAGMSKLKALLFNFIAALAAVAGTIVGLLLVVYVDGITAFIIPFAAGNFIYIAASNLLPQLHRHCGIYHSIIHLLAISAGIALIIILTLYGPGHVH